MDPALQDAARLSRPEAVAILVEEGLLDNLQVDLSGEPGACLLLDAAAQGNVRHLLLLLRSGADAVSPTPTGLTVSDLSFCLPDWFQDVLAQFVQRWTARQSQIQQEKAEERAGRAQGLLQQAAEQGELAVGELSRQQAAAAEDLKLWLSSVNQASQQRNAAGLARLQEQQAAQRARDLANLEREEQLRLNDHQKSIAQLALLRQRLKETISVSQSMLQRLAEQPSEDTVRVSAIAGFSEQAAVSSQAAPGDQFGAPDVRELRLQETEQLREHYQRERQLIESQRQLALPSLNTLQQTRPATPQLPNVQQLASQTLICFECESSAAVTICDECDSLPFCGPCSNQVHQASKRLRSHQPTPIVSQMKVPAKPAAASVSSDPSTAASAAAPAPQPAPVTVSSKPPKPAAGASLKERMKKIGGAAAFNPAMMMGGGPGSESAAAHHLKIRRRQRLGDEDAPSGLEHYKRPSAKGRRARPSRPKFAAVDSPDQPELLPGHPDAQGEDEESDDESDGKQDDFVVQEEEEEFSDEVSEAGFAHVPEVEESVSMSLAVAVPVDQPPRQQMVSPKPALDSIAAAWRDLCSNSDTNWVVCGFDAPKSQQLVPLHSGNGGLSELCERLIPDQILFAGLLVWGLDERGGVTSRRPKLIRVDFLGAKVPVARRRFALASKDQVNEAFSGCTLTVPLSDVGELTAERLGQRLLFIGGAHKPKSFDFGGGVVYHASETVDGDS